jgi:hypothetical protein
VKDCQILIQTIQKFRPKELPPDSAVRCYSRVDIVVRKEGSSAYNITKRTSNCVWCMRSVVCMHLTYAFGTELPSHMHALCWPIGTVAVGRVQTPMCAMLPMTQCFQ